MVSRKVHTLAVGVCLACLCVAPGAAQEPPTLDQIVEGLQRREKLFFESESLAIQVERTKSEDVTQTQASGGYVPVEWIMAYRGNKWFMQRRFTRPGKVGEITVPAEPKKFVIKKQLIMEDRQDLGYATLDTFKLGGNVLRGLYYTGGLALDVPKYVVKAAGAEERMDEIREKHADHAGHPFLPDFLRQNKSSYQVSSAPEAIDGRPCWVVEWPDMDRFYVDLQRGFAIPRRVYCWGPGKPPKWEFHNSDYREVKPGLWLPFTQIGLRYASIMAEDESLWGKVANRSEYRLTSVEFDTVDDSMFDVQVAEGTPVVDRVRNFRYVVSSDENADPFSTQIGQGEELVRRSGYRAVIAVVGGIALLVLLAYVLWARRKARMQRPAGEGG